jgi:hypothetical protein
VYSKASNLTLQYQESLRRGPDGPCTKEMKSPTTAGFQVHERSSLTPAHKNLARWQLKKMWSQTSSIPHIAHLPSEGPCLLATCSADGSLPLMSFQRNTLIFGGTLVARTSLKNVTVAPCDKRRYKECVEKTPDGSRAHETWSSPMECGCGSKILQIFSHSTTSAVPKVRQNLTCHSPSILPQPP